MESHEQAEKGAVTNAVNSYLCHLSCLTNRFLLLLGVAYLALCLLARIAPANRRTEELLDYRVCAGLWHRHQPEGHSQGHRATLRNYRIGLVERAE